MLSVDGSRVHVLTHMSMCKAPVVEVVFLAGQFKRMGSLSIAVLQVKVPQVAMSCFCMDFQNGVKCIMI